ncbi:MAG: hypothetical protein ABI426_09775 [Flavobacterium sp.]
MKTFIYTLGFFALLVSPTTCKNGKLNFQNSTNNTTNNSMTSRDGEDEGDKVIVIDPTKPIPKP